MFGFSIGSAAVWVLAVASGGAFAQRPDVWGQKVDTAKVKNLYRIEKDLYRSAQPDAEGFREIRKMGIASILCLRSGQDDLEPAKGMNLKLLHVSMRPWSFSQEKIVEALRIMINPENRPLLVHCQHGSDRTGVVVAMYRVVVQGWSKEEATRELKQGGFHFHSILGNIPDFIRKADVDWYRKQLGIPDPPPPGPQK